GGEVFHRNIVHRGADLAARGFDNGGFAGDGDRLCLSGHGQSEGEVQMSPDGEGDAFLGELRETGALDFDRVGSYREDREGEESACVRGGFKPEVSRVVYSRQLGGRDGRSGLAHDGALDGSWIALGTRGGGQ